MSRASRWLAVLVVLVATCSSASAQVVDLMQREIDDALADWRFRLGPFRMSPILRVGAGLDSNALSQPGPDPVQDVSFVAGPGIRGVLPMGNRGLIDFWQETGYIYFRDLTSLRNLYNISRVSGSLGGRDFVLHGTGGYRTGQVRPSSELDLPLDQTIVDVGGGLDVAIASAQQLNFLFTQTELTHDDPAGEEIEISVPNLLDRTTSVATVQFERYLTATASLIVEGSYDVIDYVDDSTERDGRGYGGVGGVVFSPRGDIRGEARFGYRRLEPEFASQADFSGFVGSADITFPFGQRFRARGLFLRDTTPSILANNWFFLETRVGGSIDVYVADRWFLRPGISIGNNTYPRPSTFENDAGEIVTEIVRDEFRIYQLSVNYELSEDLVFNVGVDAMSRDSNLPRFAKDRTVLLIGLATRF